MKNKKDADVSLVSFYYFKFLGFTKQLTVVTLNLISDEPMIQTHKTRHNIILNRFNLFNSKNILMNII